MLKLFTALCIFFATTAMASIPRCPVTSGLETAISPAQLPCSIPTQDADLTITDVNLRNHDQTQIPLTLKNNSNAARLAIVSYFAGCTNGVNYPARRRLIINLAPATQQQVIVATDCTFIKAANLWPKRNDLALIFSAIEIDVDNTQPMPLGVIEIAASLNLSKPT